MAIELYVADSPDAVRATGSDGLIEFLEDAQCENCDVIVGFGMGRFFPCVICIEDEEEVWIVCTDCAAPITNPGE